jgi:hypothetical protein
VQRHDEQKTADAESSRPENYSAHKVFVGDRLRLEKDASDHSAAVEDAVIVFVSNPKIHDPKK